MEVSLGFRTRWKLGGSKFSVQWLLRRVTVRASLWFIQGEVSEMCLVIGGRIRAQWRRRGSLGKIRARWLHMGGKFRIRWWLTRVKIRSMRGAYWR